MSREDKWNYVKMRKDPDPVFPAGWIRIRFFFILGWIRNPDYSCENVRKSPNLILPAHFSPSTLGDPEVTANI